MSSPATITFGALLRQLRRRAQMTQGDLAAAVGYSVSFISSLEQNTRRPDVHVVSQHFVPALALQEEPHLATHLLELAAVVCGDLHPTGTHTLTHERCIVTTETNHEPPTNLPRPPTPLIGREQTVKKICDRLLGHQGRLLTLVGSPGVGKTRLALEVAVHLQLFHRDGIYFVPLASVSDPAHVASVMVAALGLVESNPKPPLSRLLAFLRQKELLLLLDNFEQVIAAGPLVAELLASCPRLRVLVTSRERLHLRAEQRFWVPPLDLASACTLFVERAQAVEPDFILTPQNQFTVGEICQALDCLPLALELSAAQIMLCTLPTLLARLQEASLDLLTSGPSDLPHHQHSLRAAFDHSWHLLTSNEQALLAQLSIFRGGFDNQALHDVTNAAPQLLLNLVDKSLVRRQREERSGVERYDLHELIRQAAAERLAQMPDIESVTRCRHSAFYCRLVGAQEVRLQGPEQQAALASIALELDNIRAAWNLAVTQQQIELLGVAIHSLGLFYEWRNHYQEGEVVYKSAVQELKKIAHPSALAQQVLAEVLAWQGTFCRLAGRLLEARRSLQKSLSLLDGLCIKQEVQHTNAFTLLQYGHTEAAQTEYQAAEPYYRQALALYQLLDNDWGAANVLFGLGAMYYRLCDYEQARLHYEACLAHYRATDDHRNSADTLERLSYIFRDQSQFAEAEQLTMAAIAFYEMMNDRAKIAYGQLALGWLCNYTGRHVQAYAVVEKAAVVFAELGLTAPLTAPIVLLAIINMDLGKYVEARQQLQSYLPHCRTAGNRSDLALSLMLLAALTIVEGDYGAAELLLVESIAHYQKTGEQDRLAQAVTLSGIVASSMGRRTVAQSCFLQALQVATNNRTFSLLILALLGCSLLLAQQGEVERAVEVYAMIAGNPMVANSQLRQDLAKPTLTALVAPLSSLVVAAAHARGEANDPWSTADILLAELTVSTLA